MKLTAEFSTVENVIIESVIRRQLRVGIQERQRSIHLRPQPNRQKTWVTMGILVLSLVACCPFLPVLMRCTCPLHHEEETRVLSGKISSDLHRCNAFWTGVLCLCILSIKPKKTSEADPKCEFPLGASLPKKANWKSHGCSPYCRESSTNLIVKECLSHSSPDEAHSLRECTPRGLLHRAHAFCWAGIKLLAMACLGGGGRTWMWRVVESVNMQVRGYHALSQGTNLACNVRDTVSTFFFFMSKVEATNQSMPCDWEIQQ